MVKLKEIRLLFASSLLACLVIWQPGEAQVRLSFDGNRLNLVAENETYGNILNLVGQQTGLEFEIPTELKNRRIPLLEIESLDVKSALLKMMEGSQFDFLLLGRSGIQNSVAKLIVSGKSSKVAPPTGGGPPAVPPARDPFSRGDQPQYLTPFNQRPTTPSGAAPKQPPAQPASQQPAPLVPQQAAPVSFGRPYGRPLGGVPGQNVQPPPQQPGRVQPRSAPASSRGQTGTNNPYERRQPF